MARSRRWATGFSPATGKCHYTPDYWRNHTIIGTEGRCGTGGTGTTRRALSRVFPIEEAEGGHGGADPRNVAEFPVDVSPPPA
jgi:hypothetical protein